MAQHKPAGLTLRREVWHIDKDIYGTRIREAARKVLEENQHKRSLERDARALAGLDRYIGEFHLQRVHSRTLQRSFETDRRLAPRC